MTAPSTATLEEPTGEGRAGLGEWGREMKPKHLPMKERRTDVCRHHKTHFGSAPSQAAHIKPHTSNTPSLGTVEKYLNQSCTQGKLQSITVLDHSQESCPVSGVLVQGLRSSETSPRPPSQPQAPAHPTILLRLAVAEAALPFPSPALPNPASPREELLLLRALPLCLMPVCVSGTGRPAARS